MTYDEIDIEQIDQNSEWASSHVTHFDHDITIADMLACDEAHAHDENLNLTISKPSD